MISQPANVIRVDDQYYTFLMIATHLCFVYTPLQYNHCKLLLILKYINSSAVHIITGLDLYFFERETYIKR